MIQRGFSTGYLWLTRSAIIVLTLIFVGLSSADGFAETRKLKLYFLHTGEKAEIAFKRNGKYIAGGLTKINKLLRDWRRNEPTKMDPRLLDLIWEVYRETGSRRYIHVVSAYRSPATNKLLRKRGRGVAKKSQHTLGKALDFFIPGVNLRKLRNIGLRKGLGGVGYYPKSGSPFVHMDTGRIRHWPRMSRKELAGVFPSGKTLHVPTDGKPLARYNQAKAEYERKIKGSNKIVVARAEEIVKKPGFFARLLGRGGEEGEESAASIASAPKAVRTTTQPVAARPAVRTPEPTVANPQPEPSRPDIPTPPASAEILLASLPADLVPVPIQAPRSAPEPEVLPADTELPAELSEPEQTTLIAAVDQQEPTLIAIAEPQSAQTLPPEQDQRPILPVAQIGQELSIPRPQIGLSEEAEIPEATEPAPQDLDPALQDPATELAYAVPVPSLRPGTVETTFAESVAREPELPDYVDDTITVAALSPGEIEDLRREVYAVIQSSIKQPLQSAPSTHETFSLASGPTDEAVDTTSALSLVSQSSPNLEAERVIDNQLAALEPIEPGYTRTNTPGVPQPNPNQANEEITVAALTPIEPGVVETGKLALPVRNPEAATQDNAATVETAASNIPIPLAAQRPILVTANSGTNETDEEIRRLESLQSVSLDERILGKWALATDMSIAEIAEIRPPAYARNIIRELPSTVLSRGFVQDTNSQITNKFSGSSIEFLDFTNFN